LELRRRHHLQRSDFQGVTDSVGGGVEVSFSTFGSTQLPETWNSCAKIWPSGFRSTRCAIAAATPATGLTSATAVDAVPPRLGTTRSLRFCVSCSRSTCPDIATSAVGPL